MRVPDHKPGSRGIAGAHEVINRVLLYRLRRRTAKWHGQCPICGEWNTLMPRDAPAPGCAARGWRPAAAAERGAAALGSAAPRCHPAVHGHGRAGSGFGGGLVAGSVTLLGGDPGIGKSTLLLQAAAALAPASRSCTPAARSRCRRSALRAQRLGLQAPAAELVAESDSMRCSSCRRAAPALLVIDSIQTLQPARSASSAGASRSCANAPQRWCASPRPRRRGDHRRPRHQGWRIAGPKLLEHLVDTVLYFESDAGSRYRMLRATKNRFGAAQRARLFRDDGTGLAEVRNPAAIFLSRHPQPVRGQRRHGGARWRPAAVDRGAGIGRSHALWRAAPGRPGRGCQSGVDAAGGAEPPRRSVAAGARRVRQRGRRHADHRDRLATCRWLWRWPRACVPARCPRRWSCSASSD